MPHRAAQRSVRQRIAAIGAIALSLLAMLASIHIEGRTPPLALMTLGILAASWLGGIRYGYLAFASVTLLALLADHGPFSAEDIDDVLVFVVLSLGLIHGTSFAYRARRAEDLAMDALRARQMSMRATIDGIPALIAYVDRDLRHVMHNRIYEQWFPRSGVDGTGLHDALDRALFVEMQPHLLRALAGEAVNVVQSIERNGVRHQFDAHYRPHRDDAGRVLGVALMIHDVTERQASMEAVRASEARLRSLAMASAAIVWLVDRDGDLVEAQGWQEFTGQTAEQFRGSGWLAAVHQDDRARVERTWIAAYARGQPLVVRYRLQRADGGHRMVEAQGIPIRDDAGRTIEWIGTVRDIDDGHRLQRDLLQRERERDALLENVPHMVWIADAQGEIVFSNRRWYEYTGLEPGEHWKIATHPDDIARAEHMWRHALETGDALQVEKRFRNAVSGEYRWHLVQGVPIRDSDGTISRWYGSSVDIEDQKRAITTLAEANQRISRFISILSHELRNPISGIVTASELLARGVQNAAADTRTLEIMARHSRQLQRTIDDLLDISRVTEDRIELRLELRDLREVLEHLVADLAPEAQRRGIALQLMQASPGARLWVEVDEMRLRQIFTNLVTNAIKASAPGQTIRLEIATPLRGRCEISVSDEGPGLSEDIRETLFEPFVQAESWRRQGRGLGLAIARRLAGLHGGSLRAQEPEGVGARFVLELPLASPPRAAIARLPPPPAAYRPGRILIVEDELDNAHSLQILLESQGHRVDIATDAEIALADWREGRHDAVLCDLELPGPLDGHDVARALRLQIPRPYLIAYSGYGQPQDLIDSREAGFDEHLVKPASLEEILRALERRPATDADL